MFASDVAFHWLIFLQRNILDQADITEITISNSWCSKHRISKRNKEGIFGDWIAKGERLWIFVPSGEK